MKINLLSLLLQIIFCTLSLAQDTIKMEPSIVYAKAEAPLMTKGARTKLAREDIIYSKQHRRVEYCYYVEEQRKCWGTDYHILEDSVLVIGENERWNFRRLANGHYFVDRTKDQLYEFGEVQPLMPFIPQTPIFTTALDTKDTLWTSTYHQKKKSLGNWYWTTHFYETHITDQIYDYHQVDHPPTQLNGEPLKNILISSVVPCPSEPMKDISTVALIITKEGKIKNIEQAIGLLSTDCPYTMQEIIAQVLTWGRVEPARRKGKKVTVRWFISVNNTSRTQLHPALADTPKHRKRYLRLKNKSK